MVCLVCTNSCIHKVLHVIDDQNNMELLDLYLVHRVKSLNTKDGKSCPLHVYHEINCRIFVNKPEHLFVKVISNAATPSQTQDKITCNTVITEEKKISSVHFVSAMTDGDI